MDLHTQDTRNTIYFQNEIKKDMWKRICTLDSYMHGVAVLLIESFSYTSWLILACSIIAREQDIRKLSKLWCLENSDCGKDTLSGFSNNFLNANADKCHLS